MEGSQYCSACGARATEAPVVGPSEGSALARLIPYRNAPSLVAYYLGVFSLVPCFGLVFALAAIPLGIVGLRRTALHPEAKGKVHAWVAIGLALLSVVLHAATFYWVSKQ